MISFVLKSCIDTFFGRRRLNTVKANPYEDATREERNLVIFRDTPMNNHIDGEFSPRPFL